MGLRVTKNVGGKRIKLSAKELRSKITMNFENSVKNAQKVIRICQTIVAPTQSQQASGRAPIPPPPPPPPKKPILNNKRAKLIAELKANLKKRGLSK